MTLRDYTAFEKVLLDGVKENYLKDIIEYRCQKAFDMMQVAAGLEPVFTPVSIFDRPDYVPPSDAECMTEDEKAIEEISFE